MAELLEGQTIKDQPDLAGQVFQLKLRAILKGVHEEAFGEVVAKLWVIESPIYAHFDHIGGT